MRSNFVGYVDTLTEFSNYSGDVYELTTNPFQSDIDTSLSAWIAEKTLLNLRVLLAKFYLNDTAGGGALVKANWQPTKFGLGSDRDNWQYGTIMAEPAAGGTTTGGSITITED